MYLCILGYVSLRFTSELLSTMVANLKWGVNFVGCTN